MNVNNYGAVFLTPDELFEAVYSGKIKSFNNIFLDDNSIDTFNRAVKTNKDHFGLLIKYVDPVEPLDKFDQLNQSKWFMPEDYCPNLIEFIYAQCTTELQRNRVDLELELFAQHNMINLLYYLKYLVDTMRQNNIVWGVGRGSSVASYVLYLIGVHKIDSIKYNLDINEFLKNGEQNG